MNPESVGLNDPNWAATHRGIGYVYNSILISIVASLAIAAYAVSQPGGIRTLQAGGSGPVEIANLIARLFTTVLTIAGLVQCLSVPIPTAKGPAQLSIALWIAFIAASIGLTVFFNPQNSMVASGMTGNMITMILVGVGITVLYAFSTLAFVAFLKAVAQHLKDTETVKSIGSFTSACAITVVLMFIPILNIGGIIMALVLFFWYLRLMRRTRAAIANPPVTGFAKAVLDIRPEA